MKAKAKRRNTTAPKPEFPDPWKVCHLASLKDDAAGKSTATVRAQLLEQIRTAVDNDGREGVARICRLFVECLLVELGRVKSCDGLVLP